LTKAKVKKAKKPRTGKKPVPQVSEIKFVRKLALCNKTPYALAYIAKPNSHANPALSADSYKCVDSFKHDYLLYNVIRKFNGESGVPAIDRARAAIDKFKSVDSALSSLDGKLTWTNLALNEPVVHQILWRAARKIERLLGPVDLDEIATLASFSHGATMLKARREGQAVFKFSNENPEVTPACSELAWAFIKRAPLWFENVNSFTLVEGNRLTTVAKDFDIDRVIACEPTMNMYVQKGIGQKIKRCLRRVGIDLTDQTVNQILARLGSLSGELATIDLASASDSISIAICRLLLPPAWFELLLMTRSDSGILPSGEVIHYNKVSSMGNGFTFELETALFWAITQACEDVVAESRGEDANLCSVYGDDIVCSTQSVSAVITALQTCGFQVNTQKSFYVGPFRESCGKHYYNGIDVSPFFIRGPVKGSLEIIGLANRLRRWTRRGLGLDDPRYGELYPYVVSHLDERWRKPTIPDGYGDGALFGSLAEVMPNFNKFGYYSAKVLVQETRRLRDEDKDTPQYKELSNVYFGLGGYLLWLSGTYDKPLLEEDLIGVAADGKPLLRNPPVAGDIRTRTKRVRLYEWLDLAD